MNYGILVGRPVGFALECPDIGSDMGLLGFDIGFHNGQIHAIRHLIPQADEYTANGLRSLLTQLGGPISIYFSHWARDRIPAARNSLVEEARRKKATHLLMLDPDVAVNAYRKMQPQAWFPAFWRFALENPGCVLAAPYCGRGNEDPPVQVWRGGTSEAERQRVSWDDAAKATGWEQVSAVGTGLMLIDMIVFDRIKRPYFMDHYCDGTYTQLDYTPDIWFCERCADAGIPVWLNWDCWVGHWQNQMVPCPRTGNTRPAVEERISRQYAGDGRLREAGETGASPHLFNPTLAPGGREGDFADCGADDAIVCGAGCEPCGLEHVSECDEDRGRSA